MTFEQSERDRQHRRVNSRAQIQSNGMHKSRQTLMVLMKKFRKRCVKRENTSVAIAEGRTAKR